MGKKKILLLNPNRRLEVIGLNLNGFPSVEISVLPRQTYYEPDQCTCLATMAAMLGEGYEAKIIDAQTMKYSNEELYELIKEFQPDITGIISATMSSWRCFVLTTKHVLNACDILRRFNTKIVLMGPHGTIYPSIFKDHVDVVIKGEPEECFAKVVKNPKDLRNVLGVCYWSKGEFLENEGINHVEDINTLPLPRYDLLPMEEYREKLVSFNIFASRGCPYECVFCMKKISGTNYRLLNPEKIIKQVVMLNKEYGIKNINFYDDVFGLSKKQIIDICDKLSKSNLDLVWCTETRANVVTDPESVRAMKEAGCTHVAVGFETANEEILKNIKKKISLDQIEKAISVCKENQMKICLFTISCLPGEDDKSIEQTERFIKKTKPDYIGCLAATPLPGTEIFLKGICEGKIDERWILNHNWERLYSAVGKVGNNLSSKEVKKATLRIRKSYYSYKKLSTVYKILKKAFNVK